MKIYAVRHGLTKQNKLGILNGQRIDEPLEPEGVLQAEETAQNLPENITAIYASPMLRTKQTAEILNKKVNLEISYCNELIEIDFGSFSGRSWIDINKEHEENMQNLYISQKYNFEPFANGESVQAVKNRLIKILNEIKGKKHTGNILIVTHGGILRALYHIYKGYEIEGAKNASIHEFEI